MTEDRSGEWPFTLIYIYEEIYFEEDLYCR